MTAARGGGRRVAWLLLVASAAGAAAADPAHYPGAWYDPGQSAAAGGPVYLSNERLDRVDSFYRQFLTPLPSAAGNPLYCRDPVAAPQLCRRFVELQPAPPGGVGTRITIYER